MKNKKEMYRKEKGGVRCLACANYCLIPEGKSGICGVRINNKGKLELLVYGKAAAVNIDPIEKKPLFHFLPGTQAFSFGTIGCNFSCSFCQNWDISQALRLVKEQYKTAEVKLGKIKELGQDLPPQKIIDICLKEKFLTIAYTYNEPTIFFEYAYDTAVLAHKVGIKNVFVSNGYESKEALETIKPYLDAINIDLKAFRDDFYRKICLARLEIVKENIKRVFEMGIWLEVTTLLIPGQNDDEKELRDLAKFLVSVSPDTPWHISAFHPDYQMTNIPPTPDETLEKAYKIGKEAGLKFIYMGNVWNPEKESTYCPSCGELLIYRSGYHIQVKENFQKGKCKKCGEKIPGVW